MSPVGWSQQAVYLQSGDPNNENTPTLPYPGLLGARFMVIQPNRSTPAAEAGRAKGYQLIQTDSTMTVSPFKGAVAWWSDKTRYLVTTTVTTLGRGRVAGVFQNAITLGNYGCIQIKGPGTVKFVDSPTSTPDATGKIVIPSSTNGKADCLAAASAATYPSLGVSAGALNLGDNTCVCDLDVPETV
jgi:hypothetical protein